MLCVHAVRVQHGVRLQAVCGVVALLAAIAATAATSSACTAVAATAGVATECATISTTTVSASCSTGAVHARAGVCWRNLRVDAHGGGDERER